MSVVTDFCPALVSDEIFVREIHFIAGEDRLLEITIFDTGQMAVNSVRLVVMADCIPWA